MRTFLEETIEELILNYKDLSELVIVLPSKRAGGFFRHYLSNSSVGPAFLPIILSIEEFISQIADLAIVSNTDLLLYSYPAYKEAFSDIEHDSFSEYLGWAQILINDLNEMDRHLADPDSFFNYLESIKALEQWSGGQPPSEMMISYMQFWKHLPKFYETLNSTLREKGQGYQGMVYRTASEELEHYISAKSNIPHIFVGFNALNKAEQVILKGILEQGNGKIFWDADRTFIESPDHSAAKFLKSYFKSWKYHQDHPVELKSYFQEPKDIEVIQTQGKIGQAKYIGNIVSGMTEEQLSSTAIVLADENLLIPLLHSLPENLQEVNVTMGVPVRNLPITLLFVHLLRIHQKRSKNFYFKDVFSILNHPVISRRYPDSIKLVSTISEENRTYSSLEDLISIDGCQEDLLRSLFGNWGDTAASMVSACLEIIESLRNESEMTDQELTALYEINKIFLSISTHLKNSPVEADLKTVKTLFDTAILTATVDYQGDAYNGLQIMGVLETRVLDFENIIVASVNEGILPSGKTSASYITNDMKLQFELPGYIEKDSIYAYHFYHMLQRSSNIWLLYDGSAEGLGPNEKSRFILQLEQQGLQQHKVVHKTVSAPVEPPHLYSRQVEKTGSVLNRIKEIAAKGFSPSALAMYVRNPFDFYLRRVLGIYEATTVEETVDYSTLGTVVHETLEILYKPLQGQALEITTLESLKKVIDSQVAAQFEKSFKHGDYSSGKNLLIYEVSKRYVENVINADIESLREGHSLELVMVEASLEVPLDIPELSFDITLKGTVDRVDRLDGQTRVIDYKTGAVSQSELHITDWNEIVLDKKYGKALQVLAYAYMMQKSKGFELHQAGIVSLKNMKSGFMPFGTKSSPRGKADYALSQDVFDAFEEQLFKLIREIIDPRSPFTEKEE